MKKQNTAVFTIITENYLSKAYVFVKSFLSFNDNATVYVFIVGGSSGEISFDDERVVVFNIEDLHIQNYDSQCFYYNQIELCTGVKACAFEYLLDKKKYEKVIYFDPDIKFYSSIDVVLSKLDESNIVLTPHISVPMEKDGFLPEEELFLQVGIYNGGFVAVKNSKTTTKMINWWKNNLSTKCFIQIDKGLFFDQSWINFIPIIFDNVHVTKHPGLNVGWWNIHQCNTLTKKDNFYYINGEKLVFVHFGSHAYGLDSRFMNRVSMNKYRYFKEIYGDYQKDLENKYLTYAGSKYKYNSFNNNVKIIDLYRKIYFLKHQSINFKRSPFSEKGNNNYYNWLFAKSSNKSIVPNYIYYLYGISNFGDNIPSDISDKQIIRWFSREKLTDYVGQECFKKIIKDGFLKYPFLITKFCMKYAISYLRALKK